MAVPFVPDDFDVPLELKTDQFQLEPLGAKHNKRDHVAWMSSIEHIRSTPGFTVGNWPAEMSLAENLVDLDRHERDFTHRKGFTYSVLDGEIVIGAVYIYPAKNDEYDARVKSWVIASRADQDRVLWETVSAWLDEIWPFNSIHYASR